MTKETQEYIHNTAMSLISDMLEITDREMLTPEEEAWRESASSFIGYVEQHYRPE